MAYTVHNKQYTFKSNRFIKEKLYVSLHESDAFSPIVAPLFKGKVTLNFLHITGHGGRVQNTVQEFLSNLWGLGPELE